jgi:putative sigma-54 modulation protein
MKAKVSGSNQSPSNRGMLRRPGQKAVTPAIAVSVTFRHLEPTPALRQYAERKLNHVAARLKRACTIHLILAVDKYRHQGEVTVKAGRFAMTAREETKNLYAVIDHLADKIGRQFKDHLAKIETRRVRTASTGKILAAAEDLTGADRMPMPLAAAASER